jgi:hypothetical protein
MTAVGINNPNSYYYNRENRRAALDTAAPVRVLRMTVTRSDLDLLAELINFKYEKALKAGNEAVIRERESQLTAIAKTAWLMFGGVR